MNDDQLRAYATHIILEQARDYDYLGIFEIFESWGPAHDLTDMLEDGEASRVADLIGRAEITVSFPDGA